MIKCSSGKRIFNTEAMAEDVLIELWTKNDYVENHAPVSVYQCEDCGFYHLTSRGPMNEKLAVYLAGNKSKLNKEAYRWLEKFRKK